MKQIEKAFIPCDTDCARKPVKFAAVGDIFFGDQPLCVGFGVRSRAEHEGYESFFRHVKGTLEKYSLVTANLETVIADRESVCCSEAVALVDRGDPPAARALIDAGVNMVSLANNHIFEYGVPGLNETARNLCSAGVTWVGKKNHVIYDLEGRKVAFLAWSLLPDNYWSGIDPAEHYNIAKSLDPILCDVLAVKGQADYVVLMLHWGNELIDYPSKDQQQIARKLIDSGVDVILGHHPHVLQPIERYKGGVIAYSLGNFVMDSWESSTLRSCILEVTFGDKIGYRIIPVLIDHFTYSPQIIEDPELNEQIIATLEFSSAMSSPEYLIEVNKRRIMYRKASIWHFFKNIHRYGFRNLVWALNWGVKRVMFLLKVRQIEREDPNVVYRGPMR